MLSYCISRKNKKYVYIYNCVYIYIYIYIYIFVFVCCLSLICFFVQCFYQCYQFRTIFFPWHFSGAIFLRSKICSQSHGQGRGLATWLCYIWPCHTVLHVALLYDVPYCSAVWLWLCHMALQYDFDRTRKNMKLYKNELQTKYFLLLRTSLGSWWSTYRYFIKSKWQSFKFGTEKSGKIHCRLP